jgi:Complex I intermediate-associated protein 30 (CIA30)
MVLRWILPGEGGGHVRRYLRFRKAILNRIVNNNDMYPAPPVPLFDFVHPDDAVDAAMVQVRDKDAWRLSDDRVIGGFSESVATFIASVDDYGKYLSGGDVFESAALCRHQQSSTLSAEEDSETNESGFTPFLRWSGNLDTTVGLQSAVQRSGFAALRSPQFPLDGANLQGLFNALEIVCRSDGRMYTVNLKVSTSIPDDLYQGHIQSSRTSFDGNNNLNGDFESFVLPFVDFRLTSRGRQREVFRELDDKVCIESVGIALMDGQNGSFQFDLARIRAVNLLDGAVYESEPGDSDSNK